MKTALAGYHCTLHPAGLVYTCGAWAGVPNGLKQFSDVQGFGGVGGSTKARTTRTTVSTARPPIRTARTRGWPRWRIAARSAGRCVTEGGHLL